MQNPTILATPTAQFATPTNVHNEQVQHTIDAEYVAVDLPSGYKFYDFKNVYIKTFKQKHIRKILQGQSNQNARYMAEVINSTITCEKGYPDLVYRLCHEDFTYLQYWQRLHSMPNLPYTQMIECTNPEHIAKVESGEWKQNTLVYPQVVNKSTLDVINLDVNAEINLDRFIPQKLKNSFADASLHIMFMKDYLDMLEAAEKEIQGDDNEGIAWFLTAVPASMLTLKDATGRELSFKERFDIVDNLDPEDSMLLQEAKHAIPEFGVSQIITGKCPKCGALSKTKMVLNAHSFLPEHNLAGSTRS